MILMSSDNAADLQVGPVFGFSIRNDLRREHPSAKPSPPKGGIASGASEKNFTLEMVLAEKISVIRI